jgi:hypothetical protein
MFVRSSETLMNARASAQETTVLVDACCPEHSDARPGRAEHMAALTIRVRAEYGEMPGLRLTVPQAARLFGASTDIARAVLDALRGAAVLTCSNRGTYSLISPSVARSNAARTNSNGESTMARGIAADAAVDGSLKTATVDRLTCLIRHWTWADEAMREFERELASGWEYDEDPAADHPFGAYYHWCALLCGFGEAALDDGCCHRYSSTRFVATSGRAYRDCARVASCWW